MNCQGSGTLDVSLEPKSFVSFPLRCEAGKVNGTFNEIRLITAHKGAYFKFTVSSPDITWSFAAGWDPHSPGRDQGRSGGSRGTAMGPPQARL